MRKLLFKWLFTDKEQTAIINALYRRRDDATTHNVGGETEIRNICGKIAKELMS